MTGPEHYREAERLTVSADEWLDADMGWKGKLSTEERLSRRAGDLAAAQVHATLALAAATALNTPHPEGGFTVPDWDAWIDTASAYKRPRKDADGG